MYSTCIFCHGSLGTNESIEHFPIGRRLVFDPARGRLWVVCRKCERWNLSPIEERWEAIEECDRAFVETRLRVSTDNIGLARLREGLELVRIGAPQRREMAAWRYGDQFGRRRTRHIVLTGAGVAVATAFVILGPVTGFIAGGGWGVWNLFSMSHSAYQAHRVRARLSLPDYDQPVTIRLRQLSRIGLVRAEDDWALRVHFQVPSSSAPPLPNGRRLRASRWHAASEISTLLRGDVALQAASKLLPAINTKGATRAEVDLAVEMIGDAPEPASLFARYAVVPASASPLFAGGEALTSLMKLPKEARLALEMATHENSERRALEGELSLLHDEWQRAEEIAAIADEMFIGEEMRARLSELATRKDD